MTGRVTLSGPDVGVLEERYLVRAIRSGWVAPLGPEVDAFEAELAARCDRLHCVALSSGTAALHLALVGLGVGPGDVVLTSTMTFAATANAIVYTGAEPGFVDSAPDGNLNPALVRRAVDDLRRRGRRVAAILPVDLLGKVCRHEEIDGIAAAAGVPVVSDAAESFGSLRRGRPAASYGVAAAISFNGNKVMTTSGGGALLTDDAELARRVRYLATQARQPVAHYEHTDIGFNYRLSNLLAAVGRAQLIRIDSMIARRRALRDRYKEAFADVAGVDVFGAEADEEDNAWLTAILVDEATAGWNAGELAAALSDLAIESRPMWKPMHLQPVFAQAMSWIDGTSERLFRTGLTLPSGSALGGADQERVFAAIDRFLAR
ncbi:DegT/DnrJ/EryC1/StrS family aminotransferase [Propionicicella superfundia]|uniref:DegT/DnrJ/EryC1/StrS family aminotransferase n=1 Tax=Propionicicella superfundia TaxID=348582 RepID=UPI00041156EB|nr:aminotransferase class I/II-fold pyridoxal phosphate-dependent enzyme [Propionicicella superfundia]